MYVKTATQIYKIWINKWPGDKMLPGNMWSSNGPFGENTKLGLLVSLCMLSWHRQGSHRSLKTWNLKIWIPGLESPGIFVEVLESPGNWTYRSIFLIISIQEFSRYTSSEIWVYLCVLKVREFIEKVPEFDIGRSWNLRCQNVYEPWYNNNWSTKYSSK